MAKPGSVVLIDLSGAVTSKVRPAVVVSSDTYHATRPDVIVGLLTGNIAAATAPSDYVLQDWGAAGLHKPSAFRSFLDTRLQTEIIREIGQLSDPRLAGGETATAIGSGGVLTVPADWSSPRTRHQGIIGRSYLRPRGRFPCTTGGAP